MPSVDQATLRKLMVDLGDDRAVVAELIETFLAEGPKNLAELHAALAARDVKTLNRVAHSLKSTAATFGASELSRLCRDLERESESGLPPHAEARVRDVASEWERVRSELAAWK